MPGKEEEKRKKERSGRVWKRGRPSGFFLFFHPESPSINTQKETAAL
jgi:hypothetical protein